MTVVPGSPTLPRPQPLSGQGQEVLCPIEVPVADTGPGTPAEVVQHATAPFVTTKAPDRGTGLGLGMVPRLVESRGGGWRPTPRPGAERDDELTNIPVAV
jgi:C4-dicarboxylate-specific signal transduction histidine kinase